ncbi:AbrB family transcriptional regulator [Alicyclobacillus cycloheptanicus]|uniref:Transcriptional pleiotropic regulator of transition state genes n=1 Tax=Alicyclobacillus cycloheptanicus TaxID=1457 RepID=A0ABT9XMN9_9BACL|nr:AbrB/MazE/SpoVT family DNA-binding domain-containing protein [Alicyclobacillus cycloheptanicus]MDQ0191589.1 transcriptional pleiotropic regulator of transition state genes [Alicyclobacillus cycloheptanicus]WDM02237.1 AbrB family transcriptional regulator [Alicyclobacillus cycloheptanicus]
MLTTGLTRQLDEYGRIILPKELRESHHMDTGDPVAFFLEADSIMLKAHNPGCVFCGNVGGTSEYRGCMVCTTCKDELVALADSKRQSQAHG